MHIAIVAGEREVEQWFSGVLKADLKWKAEVLASPRQHIAPPYGQSWRYGSAEPYVHGREERIPWIACVVLIADADYLPTLNGR